MAQVPVAGPDGIAWTDEAALSEEELSLVGRHHNAIDAYRVKGESLQLVEFEGKVVAGVPLVTDLDRIDELDADDRLDFEQFYEPT